MKFFADTADIADIRALADTGLLDGVTTNPSLIHKSGRDFLEVVRRSRHLPRPGLGRSGRARPSRR
jgi:transaldolase